MVMANVSPAHSNLDYLFGDSFHNEDIRLTFNLIHRARHLARINWANAIGDQKQAKKLKLQN